MSKVRNQARMFKIQMTSTYNKRGARGDHSLDLTALYIDIEQFAWPNPMPSIRIIGFEPNYLAGNFEI